MVGKEEEGEGDMEEEKNGEEEEEVGASLRRVCLVRGLQRRLSR